MRLRLASLVLIACLPMLANATSECETEAVSMPVDAAFTGPAHHPVGRPLPAGPNYHQPDQCKDGIWFFDLNGNGLPDADEPRVFGSLRVVACSSCHGDTPDMSAQPKPVVSVRQAPTTLCLTCHKL